MSGKVDREVPGSPDTSPSMCRIKALQNLVQDSPVQCGPSLGQSESSIRTEPSAVRMPPAGQRDQCACLGCGAPDPWGLRAKPASVPLASPARLPQSLAPRPSRPATHEAPPAAWSRCGGQPPPARPQRAQHEGLRGEAAPRDRQGSGLSGGRGSRRNAARAAAR